MDDSCTFLSELNRNAEEDEVLSASEAASLLREYAKGGQAQRSLEEAMAAGGQGSVPDHLIQSVSQLLNRKAPTDSNIHAAVAHALASTAPVATATTGTAALAQDVLPTVYLGPPHDASSSSTASGPAHVVPVRALPTAGGAAVSATATAATVTADVLNSSATALPAMPSLSPLRAPGSRNRAALSSFPPANACLPAPTRSATATGSAEAPPLAPLPQLAVSPGCQRQMLVPSQAPLPSPVDAPRAQRVTIDGSGQWHQGTAADVAIPATAATVATPRQQGGSGRWQNRTDTTAAAAAAHAAAAAGGGWQHANCQVELPESVRLHRSNSSSSSSSSSSNNTCGSAAMPTGFTRVTSGPAVALHGAAANALAAPAPVPWVPTRALVPAPVALAVDVNQATCYILPASSVPSRAPGKSSSLTAPLPRPMYTTRHQH
eukprot:NODE_9895_length_1392_cov_4.912253.p1 GENE.NODE_9895_length_1392_cov_4.912253~~NODE_9895_length_1392_cov_4.912253.p1  ORF type:complete len:434 (-),score=118.15 NODE_9895_length_1392_cov_4.912253:89-1390(-)